MSSPSPTDPGRIEYQKRHKRASPPEKPEENNNNEYLVVSKRRDSESDPLVPTGHVTSDDKGPAARLVSCTSHSGKIF